MEILLIISLIIGVIDTALLVVLIASRTSAARNTERALAKALTDMLEGMRRDDAERERLLRQELSDNTARQVRSMGENILSEEQRMNAAQEQRFSSFAQENEQKLDNIRTTVAESLRSIREDNNKKLDEMRAVVDEKLQKTLDERFARSFALVNERLEQVYKGLGEMKTLANGVGDLSRVLSNVKTRGILGEIQLGAILEEIMSHEQYLTDTPVTANSRERVEFAIKLPAEDGKPVLLPIDSKFPLDAYQSLADAYEAGSTEDIHRCAEALKARVKSFAKDIRDKYICPPDTTEFAIMFLPTEGLYAEVVKSGLVEILQRDYRVNVAGPSTMAALLNSLQMGFRSVAIQKRSGEVWKVLGAAKTEFERFETVLVSAQKRLDGVHADLDNLIGVRTRGIKRSLKTVTELPDEEAKKLIAEGEGQGEE